MPRRRPVLRALVDELARSHPKLEDPRAAITAGLVTVDGIVRLNPASLVRAGAAIALRSKRRLRGEPKLTAALAAFGVSVAGRIALDVGAAAGGFTRVLLEAGASRVYAVDTGHGQLLGSLRLDPRVVNLERTNLGALDRTLVPDVIELVTIDVSYLSLREAAPQLEVLAFASSAELVALVKPQFELCLPRLPTEPGELSAAVRSAEAGLNESGWRVRASIPSPVEGAGGAREFLVHATRISSRK
jgi:23S rRNA (cytidine1920-2'-O)/16S rRNA (cytidine1409-2'-O)-methyltransferase